jgi:PAS domain S-box-containing protein
MTGLADGGENSGRIVLADDNADMRNDLERILITHGFDVEAVADGADALAAAEHRKPDLLITDITMPRLNGLGMLAAIRSNPRLRDMPVIFLSTQPGGEALEGLRAGADDYLVKPVSATELIARVDSRIALSRFRAAELAAMSRLHELSTRLTAQADLTSLLHEVLDATIALQRADFGDIQLFIPATSTLEIVVHRGLEQDFLDYFHSVDASDSSASGLALKKRARIIIEDVQTDPDFEPHRAIAAAAGFRAVQSTPLFRRGTGAPVGMLSTRFRNPHRPSADDLRLTDLYAMQAADIIAFRLAEERLQAREAHLQLALEAGRMGTWEWQADTGMLTADALHQALFGLPPQSAPQPNDVYWARMVPEEIAVAMESAKAALRDGTEFQMEHRVIRPGGAVAWMMSRGRAKHDDLSRMIGISLDITENKRIVEALRQSQGRLQAAVDLLGLGLYAWNPQTNALNWDARVKAIWGLSPDAPVDYDAAVAAIHRDDYPQVQAAIAKCIDPAGDGVYELEYRVIGADGMERWVATRGQTTFDRGRAMGFLGVALDVTARKRTEQAMRESDERFRQFADYSSNVLWILDLQTRRLDYLSPAYENVWGQPRDAVPKLWTETIHADDRDGAAAALKKAQNGEPVTQEYRIVRPDGTVRWIRDTLFPIRDRVGRVPRIGGIAEDITVDSGSLVYVVDTDKAMRQGLVLLLQRAGYGTKTFASPGEFLKVAPVLSPGCVVLHVRSDPDDGLVVLKQLKAGGSLLPVIALGASHGDVSLPVQAMKAGAVDWLEMPYQPDALLASVAAGLADLRQTTEQSRAAGFARARIVTMSAREREVLEGLLSGGTNKTIAKKLGISPRTVELHRASVMERLGVRTLPEAVLMAASAGIRPSGPPRKA